MTLGDMPADCIAQGLRTIEIGKPLGQIERAGLRGELGHLGEDSDADIRQLAGDHWEFPASTPGSGAARERSRIAQSPGMKKGAHWAPCYVDHSYPVAIQAVGAPRCTG